MAKRIMIADDDPGIVEAIEIMLQMEGYEVTSEMNGSIITTIKQQLPHLVLLDVWMPVYHGTDICRMLKADEATRHIPVILISASGGIQQTAANCGADDFLEKPFELKDLIGKVKEHIL